MTNLKLHIPLKKKPIVRDPAMYPRVQLPLEKEMKDDYEIELNKMVVDITKVLSKI